MDLSSIFGGNKDTDKSGSDSGMGIMDTLKETLNNTMILGAVVAGTHAATYEPTSPSTYADQGGHYAVIQQEERVDAAFDRPAEAAREAMDGKK